MYKTYKSLLDIFEYVVSFILLTVSIALFHARSMSVATFSCM